VVECYKEALSRRQVSSQPYAMTAMAIVIVIMIVIMMNVVQLPSGIIASDLYYKVGSFCEEMGKYDGALDFYMEARFLYNTASQPINVARTECAVAHIYHIKGRYQQAEHLFKDALAHFKKEKGMSTW